MLQLCVCVILLLTIKGFKMIEITENVSFMRQAMQV